MGVAAQKLDSAEAGYWLVDESTGKVFALKDGFAVGRAGGDLQILDNSVSSKHCVFHLNGRALEVEDVGSRNGVKVGGTKIEPKKRLALLPGAKLQIGNRHFTIRAGEQPKERATAVELASLCSQLEPDGIPAPHPGAWSSATVPGGRGRPEGNSPKAPVRGAEPVALRGEGSWRANTTGTQTQTRTMNTASPKLGSGRGVTAVIYLVVLLGLVAGGAWFVLGGKLTPPPRALPSAAEEAKP
jgi:pSer/pThr/pTyr-binding forkhead associated (FHA) protein